MYHSMCVVMCVYEDPQKVSHVSGVRESQRRQVSTRPVQCNEGAPDHPAGYPLHEAVLRKVGGDMM